MTDPIGTDLTVSVALCTHNGEHHIASQLDSILGQTRIPDEVLIADDASQDKTAHLLATMAEAAARRTPPVKVEVRVNPTNLGFIANFQQVLARCRGDVIFLADQDDVWLPEKIATMLSPFREDPTVGLVYSDAALVGSDLQPLDRTLFGTRSAMNLARERRPDEVVRQLGINGCTMAVRRELLAWILPIPATWGHDHWIAFLAHALGRVRPVDRPLMLYRRHPGTAGNDPLLEGGEARVWAKGLAQSGLDAYAADLAKWRDMSRQLDRLAALENGATTHTAELASYVRECRLRMEFAADRLEVKRIPRGRRLGPWLRLVKGGRHGRYLHGWRSLLKDLML